MILPVTLSNELKGLGEISFTDNDGVNISICNKIGIVNIFSLYVERVNSSWISLGTLPPGVSAVDQYQQAVLVRQNNVEYHGLVRIGTSKMNDILLWTGVDLRDAYVWGELVFLIN